MGRFFVGITGASGHAYAEALLRGLVAGGHGVDLCITRAGALVLRHELGVDAGEGGERLGDALEGWLGAEVAGGIEVAAPPRLAQVLEALQESNGEAVAVDDDQVLRFQRLLAEREGIFAEPTSAASFAGLSMLVDQGKIEPNEAVMVPITGSGLKDQASG